jgi:hypothetical protein
VSELEALAAGVLARMKPDRAAAIRSRGYINIEPQCGIVVPVSLTSEILEEVERIVSRKDAEAQRRD